MFFLDGFFTNTYIKVGDDGKVDNWHSRFGSKTVMEIKITSFNYFVLTNQITLSNKLQCSVCCRFLVFLCKIYLSHVRTKRSLISTSFFFFFCELKVGESIKWFVPVVTLSIRSFVSRKFCERAQLRECQKSENIPKERCWSEQATEGVCMCVFV